MIDKNFHNPIKLLIFALVVPILLYVCFTNSEDYVTDPVVALTCLDKVYFGIVTFTTLGYGDISPKGSVKFLASFQALMGPVCVGYFIYAYGEYNSSRERVKYNKLIEDETLRKAITNFDRKQSFYRDLFSCYSQLFSNMKLEYMSAFRRNEVCFYQAADAGAYLTKSHYYDFGRNLFLIERFDTQMCIWIKQSNPQPFLKIQSLIDLYVSSMQPRISSASIYAEINQKYIQDAVDSIRYANELYVVILDIREKMNLNEDSQDSLKEYRTLLTRFLQTQNGNLTQLINRKSISVLAEGDCKLHHYTKEERLEFLEEPYEWQDTQLEVGSD